MKNVTLIVFEGVTSKWEDTGRVFDYCRRLFDFGAEHYITRDFSKKECMAFEMYGFLPLVETSHALICTWDGFIVHPHLWREQWLEYDFIGAPWPASWGVDHQVGNTGFTLQSRKFLQALHDHRHLYDQDNDISDAWMCRTMHERFTSLGLRYAPVAEAGTFSWEHYIEGGFAGPDKSFGFHGWVAGKNKDHYYSIL